MKVKLKEYSSKLIETEEYEDKLKKEVLEIAEPDFPGYKVSVEIKKGTIYVHFKTHTFEFLSDTLNQLCGKLGFSSFIIASNVKDQYTTLVFGGD